MNAKLYIFGQLYIMTYILYRYICTYLCVYMYAGIIYWISTERRLKLCIKVFWVLQWQMDVHRGSRKELYVVVDIGVDYI